MRFRDIKQGDIYSSYFKEEDVLIIAKCEFKGPRSATFIYGINPRNDWFAVNEGKTLQPATKKQIAKWKAQLTEETSEAINNLTTPSV